ncbi:diacylglycerol/lipid kinase family protein [Nonlabens marinus]|uniref:Transcription regulator n=1 Tax=Nonlabens marinus S1-08 TaxID=1454201 RepID=W8VWA1_9FLAO|nr:diacylglycerol kinase family protein [Nonlabens marinus]BAO56143.1 transcription regulator [Nonlabens marinus S1-08]
MSKKLSKDKILIVVNPVSGGIDKTQYLNKAKTRYQSSYALEVYHTTGKDDDTAIKKLLKESKISRIVVMGGDGTVKLVVPLVDNQTIIGVVPLGSSNGLATDLDLPTDIEEAIAVAINTNTRYIDTLKINDHLGLHISDMGLNAELIKNYSETNIRGHFGYAMNVLPTLFKSDMPMNFTVRANEQVKEFNAVMVAFANSKKFGTGVTINPDGVVDDGFFEILIFKNLDTINVLKTIMGKIDLDSEFVEVIKTKEAQVSSERGVSLQIDGEFCDYVQKVSISILPKNICIAVPKTSSDKQSSIC